MPTTQEYITDNNLPCVMWLDGGDSTTLVTSGTFTWRNKLTAPTNSPYDFLQTTTSLFPTVANKGVSFTGNQRLVPRSLTLFNGVESYSLIAITQTNKATAQQLLAIGNTISTRPKLIEYRLSSSTLEQRFSLINVRSSIYSPTIIDTVLGGFNSQRLLLSHYIKRGDTVASTDGITFKPILNFDKGFINITPYLFYLGNNDTALPWTGRINHLLLFIPAIENSYLTELSDILFDTLNTAKWDTITTAAWDSLTSIGWDNI